MKDKTVFYCKECGNETGKWFGQCPACGTWNSLVEAPAENRAKTGSGNKVSMKLHGGIPKRISELDATEEIRFSTGIGELDRVLGGGAVKGSMVLIGGAPGIGKSTMLLQICGLIQSQKILYVTGEESQRQLKLRADRLNVNRDSIYVLSETRLMPILDTIHELEPDIVIIDSIQTVYQENLQSGAGSITQVRECTMSFLQDAKSVGYTCFMVGHINKEGAIAGPKVLEHMVDCVLYFEGDRAFSYRVLRAAKNRFGSTNEIGVFEMSENGLIEVPNPSEILLSGRPKDCPGTCVTCVMEGSRPILAEIQALVSSAGNGAARKTTNGFDYNRLLLLTAVLDKRGGINIGSSDIYVNVIGGLDLNETAADLATVLAIASSARDLIIRADTAAVGEVGLTGEIRSVSELNKRLNEIARLGFKRCIIPQHVHETVHAPDTLEVISVRNVRQAIEAVLLGK